MKLYYTGAELGAIDLNNIRYYKCQNWAEDENHGGDVDTGSPITSGQIFDDVSSQERRQGDTEYRKIFLKNENLTTVHNAIWIGQNTPSQADEIYICASGTSADTVQDASGYNYIQPSGWDSGFSLGDLEPNACYPIWIKRVVKAGYESYLNNAFQIIVGQE